MKMKITDIDYSERLEFILNKALKKENVEEIEVFCGANNVLTIRSAVGMILESKLIQDAGIGLRLLTNDHCMGFSSTCDLSDDSLMKLIDETMSVAKYRKVPVNYGFSKPTKSDRKFSFYDKKLVDAIFDYSDINLKVNNMITDSKGLHKSITETSGPVHLVEYSKYLQNSHGVRINEKGTFWQAELFAIAESSTDRREGSDSSGGWKLSEFKPEKLANHAAKMAVDCLDGENVERGDYEIILSSGSVATFLDWLSMLTLPQYQEKNMPLLRDRIGDRVASEEFTVINDPLKVPSPISGAYDDEGSPTQEITLFENGIYKGMPLDTYYANKFDAISNGNGYRTVGSSGMTSYPGQLYQSEPVPSLPSIYMKGGNSSVEEMIADVKKGVYLDYLHYAYITNGATGDYTGILRQGSFLIKNGEIKTPLKKCRLMDNIIEMAKGIQMVGESTMSGHWTSRLMAPPVKIDKVSLEPY
jgi:PmbA protein